MTRAQAIGLFAAFVTIATLPPQTNKVLAVVVIAVAYAVVAVAARAMLGRHNRRWW